MQAKSAATFTCSNQRFVPEASLVCATYVHIQSLSITPVSVDNGRYNNELVLSYEVPYATLVLSGVMLLHGVDFELEGRSCVQKHQQKQRVQQPG
jgi:hypothetical protein